MCLTRCYQDRSLSDLLVRLPARTLFEREESHTMDDAVRIHLADDHTMFREGLQAILASREELEVVGTSTTGEEAASLIAKSKPDLVIAQLDMQIKTAQEILDGVQDASPDSKIVVLAMFDNLHYLKALSRLGIDAYLHKTSSSEELLDTIDAVSHQPGGRNAVI